MCAETREFGQISRAFHEASEQQKGPPVAVAIAISNKNNHGAKFFMVKKNNDRVAAQNVESGTVSAAPPSFSCVSECICGHSFLLYLEYQRTIISFVFWTLMNADWYRFFQN